MSNHLRFDIHSLSRFSNNQKMSSKLARLGGWYAASYPKKSGLPRALYALVFTSLICEAYMSALVSFALR